jgi:ferrochelatase
MSSVSDKRMSDSFDAILVVSFGGPEGMDDVIPFLRNVLKGRNVPEERLQAVAKHYEMFGGVSPINGQNRALISALRNELDLYGPRLPIYWGNRNWTPFLSEALKQMKKDGVKNSLAFFTSAYSSYSGCRQYRENIEHAAEQVGEGAPKISKLRAFYNHPGFIEPNIEAVATVLNSIPSARRDAAAIAFTAHSIPESMSAGCEYQKQLTETCSFIANALGHVHWKLVFQSRSGAPGQPWLGPDICDHLRILKEQGFSDVVVSPVGFISDHLEVKYDLDTQAAEVAMQLGLNMVRAPTIGIHPRFIRMIRELINERIDDAAPRLFLGNGGPSHDICPIDCCLPGTARPANSGPIR